MAKRNAGDRPNSLTSTPELKAENEWRLPGGNGTKYACLIGKIEKHLHLMTQLLAIGLPRCGTFLNADMISCYIIRLLNADKENVTQVFTSRVRLFLFDTVHKKSSTPWSVLLLVQFRFHASINPSQIDTVHRGFFIQVCKPPKRLEPTPTSKNDCRQAPQGSSGY